MQIYNASGVETTKYESVPLGSLPGVRVGLEVPFVDAGLRIGVLPKLGNR